MQYVEIATSSPCYLGIDDGYFDINLKRMNRGSKTVLVGIVMCGRKFADMFIDRISIDGLDGTSSASRVIAKASTLYPIQIAFLDGVTYAGFNIIDPRRIYNIFNIPLAVIFRHQLDVIKIFKALKEHFTDYTYRYSIIDYTYRNSLEVKVDDTKIRVYVLGLSIAAVIEHIEKVRRVFIEPYPLRVADRLASLLGRIVMSRKTLNYNHISGYSI